MLFWASVVSILVGEGKDVGLARDILSALIGSETADEIEAFPFAKLTVAEIVILVEEERSHLND